jgi:hypothetical protein
MLAAVPSSPLKLDDETLISPIVKTEKEENEEKKVLDEETIQKEQEAILTEFEYVPLQIFYQ